MTSASYRMIRADEIIRTAARLVARVRDRFPDAGLARVADEILAVAREADERCRLIRRPNLALRLGVVALIVLGAGLAALVVRNVRLSEEVWDISNFTQASEALLGDVVFLGAAIAFLVTLENRVKRSRAIRDQRAARAGPHHRHAPAHEGPGNGAGALRPDPQLAGTKHDGFRAQPLPRLLQRDAGPRLRRSLPSTCRASRTPRPSRPWTRSRA